MNKFTFSHSERIVAIIWLIMVMVGASMANVPLNISVEDFEKEAKEGLVQARRFFEQLQKIDGPKTVETVLQPFNEMQMIIDRYENLASLFQVVHPDENMRKVAEKLQQEYARLETEINLSRPLYEAVVAVPVEGMDGKTRFFHEKLLKDFRRSGVDKDPATREKIRRLEEELVKLGQEFGKNIRNDVRYIYLDDVSELAGLPQDYIDNHQPGEDGKIAISTDYPDYYPFMAYAKSDARRKELYIQYRQRGYPANQEILKKILEKRYELARLLGYPNYAAYATADKMIESPENAAEFINRVAEIAKPRAEKDYELLLKKLREIEPGAERVEDWQKGYLSELVQKDLYAFDSQELRQYFPYEKVKEGVLNISAQLYGVTFKKVDEPAWHESVDVYEMYLDGRLFGKFYLDMHPRPNKYKHAMMTEVVTGISGKQIPEAALVCNFPGGDGSAGLMQHDQVSTFFHEFGHLLHHLFGGHQPWMGISGISTEWDFVETPSTLFEEWVWNGDVLKQFAVNEKGETLPDELIEKLNKTRKFRLGIDVRQQMYYAALSLNFYNRDPKTLDMLQMVRDFQEKYTPFRYVPDTYMHLSFGHLFGYSAIYYTYMWSNVMAKDIFSLFEEKGMMNSEIARRYRRYVLEPGGSKKAADLMKDFLGRPYSFEAFERYLNQN